MSKSVLAQGTSPVFDHPSKRVPGSHVEVDLWTMSRPLTGRIWVSLRMNLCSPRRSRPLRDGVSPGEGRGGNVRCVCVYCSQ